MPDSDYRSTLFDHYVSAQHPEWATIGAKADASITAGHMARIRDWLPADKNARCLDAACGSGSLLEALRSRGYTRLEGVDISPESVKMARARGFEVAQSDLCGFLESRPASFELITAFDILEHFRKDELLGLLRLLRSSLAPGGRVIIQTPNALSPWASHYRYGDMSHEWIFATSSLKAALSLAGFRDFEAREVEIHVHGAFSAVRWLGWKVLRNCYAAANLIETGSTQGGIFTRNLLCTARTQ